MKTTSIEDYEVKKWIGTALIATSANNRYGELYVVTKPGRDQYDVFHFFYIGDVFQCSVDASDLSDFALIKYLAETFIPKEK